MMNDKALTNKIADYIRDEAAKELPPGYICLIGGEDEKAVREAVVKERFILRQYAKTPDIFLRISPVRAYLERRAAKKGKAFFEDMIGECLLEELDDVDAVLLYPDRLLRFYNSYLKDNAYAETDMAVLEDVSRGFARHECRHASQFVVLRDMGLDPSTVLNWEFSTFDYGEGPLETDAFHYQFHETEQSVDEVCRYILKITSL